MVEKADNSWVLRATPGCKVYAFGIMNSATKVVHSRQPYMNDVASDQKPREP